MRAPCVSSREAGRAHLGLRVVRVCSLAGLRGHYNALDDCITISNRHATMPSDRGVCVGDGPALPHTDIIVMIEGGAASKLQGLITGLSREMTRRMSIHNCL
jgi:hypothetical protein